MKLVLLSIIPIIVVSCATQPNIEVNRELGRHPLPYKANKRFVLTKITAEAGYNKPPSSIEYFLDGRRHIFKPSEAGSADGYITYLGRLFSNEVEGVESPVMDEQVIRLQTGEEITVGGNTIDPKGIRLIKQ